MNRKALYVLFAATFISLFALVACGSKGGGSTETGTGDGTGSGASASTEAVTAIPRYDYMNAEVAPDVDIEPSDYTDLSLTIPNSLRVTEQDVENYILNIRYQYRIAENGTTAVTDKALKLGDDAYIYYKGLLNGEEFEGGSNWDDEEPYQLGLGSCKFIDGFEASLVGIVPNTTSKDNPAEIHVTFPEGYSEELGGKEVTFLIVVTKSVQYKLPDYTKAFVLEDLEYETTKEFYASDKAILTEFEGFVQTQLEDSMATDIENAKVDALWNHLIEAVTCQNLPQLEVDYYVSAYKSEVEYYYSYYSAYSGDTFLAAYPDIDSFAVAYFYLDADADWEAEVRHMAEQMVCKDMITHAIGELEGIESVTDEEIDEQIDYWVTYYSGYMTESDVVQSMGEVFLTESAFAAKMKAWLLERVSFTYENGSPIGGETAADGAGEDTGADETTA